MVNDELIRNIVQSHTDNAVAGIVGEVRDLALKYGWSIEEVMEVAALVSRWRDAAIKDALETTQLVMSQVFEGGKK